MTVNPTILIFICVAILGIFTTLIGIIYRSVRTQIDSKVGIEKYLEAMSHIDKALDAINGTATTLKNVEASIKEIEHKLEEKYLTIREHELQCAVVKKNVDRSGGDETRRP